MTGKWLNDTTATIMAIPEPATVLLLSLSGMALVKRKHKV
jgi:hypothetical protein